MKRIKLSPAPLSEKEENNFTKTFFTFENKTFEEFETKCELLDKTENEYDENFFTYAYYRCDFCDKDFDFKKSLNIHVTKKHKCYYCHKITVTKDNNGLCDKCDKKLSPVLILTRIKEDSIKPLLQTSTVSHQNLKK